MIPLTVQAKLTVSAAAKASVLHTIYTVNSVCNSISRIAFEQKAFNKIALQKLVYDDVRSRFNLSSQFAIRAIAKVANSYATDKSCCHVFSKHGAIDFDARLLNWNDLETVSILTIDARLQLPITFPPFIDVDALKQEQLKVREYRASGKKVETATLKAAKEQQGANWKPKKRTKKKPEETVKSRLHDTAQLIYRNNEFYLLAVIDADEQPITAADGTIFHGVDVGITNLATTSYGKIFSGKQADTVRIRYNKLRSNLQSVGTKSAKKKLKRISKKEALFKRNQNHIISRYIVAEAKKHNAVIALEDLYHLRVIVSKAHRQRFGNWAFYQLAQMILYKARIAGVPVVKVNPAYTSQTCSQCGHRERANRKGEAFCCKRCSFSCHADLNAAINIARLAEEAAKMDASEFSGACGADVNQPIVAMQFQRGLSPLNERQTSPFQARFALGGGW